MPFPAELQEAAATLKTCEKVTMLAGACIERAHEEILALADTLPLSVRALASRTTPFDIEATRHLGFQPG